MSHLLAASAGSGTNADVLARETIFWILFIVSSLAAIGMILVPRAVHCALLLAVVMLSLATFYAMQGAPFLAFVQIIVYTGAVLMLFLFVLMLIGIHSSDSIVENIKGQRFWVAVFAIGFSVLLALAIGHAALGPPVPQADGLNGANNLTGLAQLVFTTYVFPFEVTGALLITAALGAMVLAHSERTTPKPTQRDRSERRIAGGHPAPDPSSGVYALHDAVDRPALLPDGSTSPHSVSSALVQRVAGSDSGPPEAPQLVMEEKEEVES
jgi:NADH-quinone oxidoreductase subunit J